MAQDNIDELLAGLSTAEEDYTSEAQPGEFLVSEEEGFQWLISPEQFVDFWIAAIFLLVGTWQIITMFFLVMG